MQIHELNDFNGELDAFSFLAIDDGNDTGKISAENLLLPAISEISAVESALNGRIDNIIAGGDAPSEAEIIDARLGADGVNYPSLGDAIRIQFEDCENNLNKVENIVYGGSDKFKPKWEIGTVNDTSHKVNTTIRFRAYTQMLHVYGDRIISSGVPNNVRLKAYFYDANKTYVEMTTWVQNTTIGTNGSPYVILVARYEPEDSSATMSLGDLSTIEIQNYAYVMKQIDDIKAAATSRNAYVDNQLSLMNSVNLFNKVLTKTTSGITYTSTGDGYIKLNGSYTSDVYFDISALADLAVEPGGEYWLNYEVESSRVSCLALYFDTGGGLTLGYNNLFGLNRIKIPEGTTALLLRLYAKANITFSNKTIKLTISKAKSNIDLEPAGEFRFLQAFGTGDCTIIKFENGEVLVIDFGLAEPQHTLQRNWTRAVTDLKITHIDYAVISHYHPDHVGLLIDTDTSDPDYVDMSDFIDNTTTFFLPNGHAYTQEELDALAWVDTMSGDTNVNNYNAVMAFLSSAGCKIVYPSEDEIFDIGNCPVQFWNANQKWIMDKFADHETYDYNEASMCCNVTIGTNRICFSGDIGEQAMDKFKKSVMASNIFKVNHHCVGYGVVPIFLNSLMPRLCISMLGNTLCYAYLGSSAMQAWCEENKVPNVITGINEKNLSLRVSADGYIWNTSCRKLICADEGITTP